MKNIVSRQKEEEETTTACCCRILTVISLVPTLLTQTVDALQLGSEGYTSQGIGSVDPVWYVMRAELDKACREQTIILSLR